MPDPDPNLDARRAPRRRDFLRSAAAGAAGTWIPGIWIAAGWRPLFAGALQDNEYARLIPADKKLDPAWVRSLTERGKPQEYTGEALDKVGCRSVGSSPAVCT